MQKLLPFSAATASRSGGSGFTFHEGMRIVVPGFYVATLLLFLYWTFLWKFFAAPLPTAVVVILFLFAGLVSGLTAYAKETAKRRRAFTENQPSQYLLERSRTLKATSPLSDDDARRLYFYILNNYIPAPFHEKIFFFGTIYHIMILVRRTSFWFTLVFATLLAFEISQGTSLPDLQGLSLLTIAVLLIYLLNVRYNKADRKMQENYQDQIFWLRMNGELVDDLLKSFGAATPRK
jgi:membrane protein implicated in regulation of membrane protease activity